MSQRKCDYKGIALPWIAFFDGSVKRPGTFTIAHGVSISILRYRYNSFANGFYSLLKILSIQVQYPGPY
jgi:hypothetical protein